MLNSTMADVKAYQKPLMLMMCDTNVELAIDIFDVFSTAMQLFGAL